MNSDPADKDPRSPELGPVASKHKHARVEDPQFVLALLEADQLVAAKGRSRFGRRELSFGVRVLLWSLRIYVVVMLLIVLVSVLRALHSAP